MNTPTIAAVASVQRPKVAFKKAERSQTKLKLALTGPSGSGKTLGALSIASGIGKKIAVIDTENGSASLYADRFEFETLILTPPYTIPKYNEGIRAAQEAGYDVLIVDSLTHAWAGDGGLLAKKEALDAKGGNSFTNWAGISKEHELFKSMLLHCNVHLICTMRSKTDYVLEENEKGKKVPRKVGLGPIQRDGMEYEFTSVLDLAMDHHAHSSKDRTGLFDGQITMLNADVGKSLMGWLREGGNIQSVPAINASTEVHCRKCGAEVVLVGSKHGYFCPDYQLGHTKFPIKDLEKFQRIEQELKQA